MNAEWNGQFILSCDSGKNSQRIEYMSIGEMSISNISDSVRDGVVFVCLFVCVCVCVCVSWGGGCWSGWFDGTGVSEQADAAWCVSDLMFM